MLHLLKFPQHTYFHCGGFQATSMKSLNREMGRVAQNWPLEAGESSSRNQWLDDFMMIPVLSFRCANKRTRCLNFPKISMHICQAICPILPDTMEIQTHMNPVKTERELIHREANMSE